jgi:hypothetical protein
VLTAIFKISLLFGVLQKNAVKNSKKLYFKIIILRLQSSRNFFQILFITFKVFPNLVLQTIFKNLGNFKSPLCLVSCFQMISKFYKPRSIFSNFFHNISRLWNFFQVLQTQKYLITSLLIFLLFILPAACKIGRMRTISRNPKSNF